MKIYDEKIYEIIAILNTHFSKKDDDYASVDLPNTIKYKSNKWLIYIFYSCLLNYGMKSKIYHKNLISTYNKYPEIFNYKVVIDKFSNNQELLFDIIKNNIHPRYPNVAVKKWMELSIELSKYDNLLNEVKQLNSFSELAAYIKSIKGFGQKTGGLLLRLIYEANICDFDDDLPSIPLDRHDIEISYLNNIIESKNLTPKQIDLLSDSYINNGKKLGIKANVIDKYLWEIGNQYCNKKDCINCPLFINCKTKINVVIGNE